VLKVEADDVAEHDHGNRQPQLLSTMFHHRRFNLWRLGANYRSPGLQTPTGRGALPALLRIFPNANGMLRLQFLQGVLNRFEEIPVLGRQPKAEDAVRPQAGFSAPPNKASQSFRVY